MFMGPTWVMLAPVGIMNHAIWEYLIANLCISCKMTEHPDGSPSVPIPQVYVRSFPFPARSCKPGEKIVLIGVPRVLVQLQNPYWME